MMTVVVTMMRASSIIIIIIIIIFLVLSLLLIRVSLKTQNDFPPVRPHRPNHNKFGRGNDVGGGKRQDQTKQLSLANP